MPFIRTVIDYVDRGRMDPKFLPARRVLIGTHHKTGTVWMRNVFAKVARKTGTRFRIGPAWDPRKPCDIHLEYHSRFDEDFLARTPHRGMHIIRDPRDVIVSGTFYHQTAREPWLLRKRDHLGGLTYQDKINSYSTFEDKLLFDMENGSLRNILLMLDWNYGRPDFLEVKYEDLIVDRDLSLFHDIFLFLGYGGAAIPLCLDVAFRRSLFSATEYRQDHVRSGAPRQWPDYFTVSHRRRFVELFGDALVRLGYESDDSWVDAPLAAAS